MSAGRLGGVLFYNKLSCDILDLFVDLFFKGAEALKRNPSKARIVARGDDHILQLAILGRPNAGKSTLIARISAAHPKIADYPFTTPQPNLGVVSMDEFDSFMMADIPGLIEGAHQGQGLGIEFLRHIERTRVLLHMVSCEYNDIDQSVRDYHLIERELSGYSDELSGKPRLVVLSKTDMLDADEVKSFGAELNSRLGKEVFSLSAVTGDGLENLLRASSVLVGEAQAAASVEEDLG